MTVYPIPGFSDPFSSMTHLFSTPVFLALGVAMLWKLRGDLTRSVSLTIYCFSVVFLLTMSGVFHLLTPGTTGRYVLQVLDHAAIFFLIAGTFTPVHILQFRGILRWGVLLLVWSIAITGLTLKSIYFEDVPEVLSLSLYLGLGWLGLVTAYYLIRQFGFKTVSPLIYGAIAYTTGATMEFLHSPVLVSGVIGPHEIFHVLVLAGIGFHWQFVHRMAALHRLQKPASAISSL